MQGTRLKVISELQGEDFEVVVNGFLSELDANNLNYEISFKQDDAFHCAYISYSTPKLNVPIKENHKSEYCNRCQYFNKEHKGLGAYCNYHSIRVKFGGFCCEEFYQGFRGDM